MQCVSSGKDRKRKWYGRWPPRPMVAPYCSWSGEPPVRFWGSYTRHGTYRRCLCFCCTDRVRVDSRWLWPSCWGIHPQRCWLGWLLAGSAATRSGSGSGFVPYGTTPFSGTGGCHSISPRVLLLKNMLPPGVAETITSFLSEWHTIPYEGCIQHCGCSSTMASSRAVPE